MYRRTKEFLVQQYDQKRSKNKKLKEQGFELRSE